MSDPRAEQSNSCFVVLDAVSSASSEAVDALPLLLLLNMANRGRGRRGSVTLILSSLRSTLLSKSSFCENRSVILGSRNLPPTKADFVVFCIICSWSVDLRRYDISRAYRYLYALLVFIAVSVILTEQQFQSFRQPIDRKYVEYICILFRVPFVNSTQTKFGQIGNSPRSYYEASSFNSPPQCLILVSCPLTLLMYVPVDFDIIWLSSWQEVTDFVK